MRTIKRQLVKRSLELLKDIAARPSEDPRGDYSERAFALHSTAACPTALRGPQTNLFGLRPSLGAACVGCSADVASDLTVRSTLGVRSSCSGNAGQAPLQPQVPCALCMPSRCLKTCKRSSRLGPPDHQMSAPADPLWDTSGHSLMHFVVSEGQPSGPCLQTPSGMLLGATSRLVSSRTRPTGMPSLTCCASTAARPRRRALA